MSGRLVRGASFAISTGKQKVAIPLPPGAYAKLEANGSALVSFTTPSDAVQTLVVSLVGA